MASANSRGSFIRNGVMVILAALALQYLVRAKQAGLSAMANNGPPYHRLPSVNAFASSSVRLKGQVRNCEDVVLVEDTGAAILSCDPGRDGWNTVMGSLAKNRGMVPNGELFLYRYDKTADHDDLARIQLAGFADGTGQEDDFHPLGIEYHAPSSRLFVINHHINGSRLEVFSLDMGATPLVAKHLRTVAHPLLYAPNSLVAASKTELYVTNDHYFTAFSWPWLSFFETYLAPSLAGVTHIKLDDRALEQGPSSTEAVLEATTVARLPFSNGIILLNSTTLAVASTSGLAVHLYELGPRPDGGSNSSSSLSLAGTVALPFFPDNLSVDARGALLIAGHPHPRTLVGLKEQRRQCMDALHGSGGGGEGPPVECAARKAAPSWVSEWTEQGGLRHLYVAHDGFGTSSTAARAVDQGFGVVTGLYEEGILVWKED